MELEWISTPHLFEQSLKISLDGDEFFELFVEFHFHLVKLFHLGKYHQQPIPPMFLILAYNEGKIQYISLLHYP